MNAQLMRPVNKGERAICYCKKKLTSVYHASVLLVTLNYIITLSKQLWIPSQYLDNVLTKFMINNRTDA